MFDRVIVPLDGSEFAESALPYASELAVRFGAELVLLHVIPNLYTLVNEQGMGGRMDFAETAPEDERAGGTAYLASVEERMGLLGLPRLSSRLIEDDPVEALLQVVAEAPTSTLVVMSTHGRGGLRRLTLGSVADRVIRSLEGVPILLYRPAS